MGRRKRPRSSKPLHYHSGNLPDMSGYEFRRRSIFAVGFHAALSTSTALLFWMQRLDLNQRFLAYETSEDDRSSTLQ